MNQIQSSTQTVISKFGTIPEKSSSEFSSRKVEVDTKQDESGKNRRRRSASGDSNESSDSEDDSAGSSEDSDDEVSVDLPEILDSHDVHIDKKVINEQEFVIFRIIGHAEENVNMAYDHLERIVKGDRIKDVMENLKAVSRHFVKRESPSKKDRERTDKVVTGSATKPPRKTPAERKPIDEKPSEKDGLWKRGERADKYEPSKEKRTEHSGKFSSSEKKVPTEAATERSKDNNSSAATNSNQESNKGDNHVNKPDKSSDKAAVNRSEKPEKPQLGKFEKRVSGPPAKPYSSESPRSERKGSASSADKKPHPTNKDKSNGDKKSTSAGKQQPNK